MKTIVVIGAGIGGLSAAIRLARAGYAVQIIEARTGAGGLASGLSAGGHSFDAGPYILLDKPGLDWVFERLQIRSESLPLIPIEMVYSVLDEDGRTTAFYKDVAQTAAGFDLQYAGSGERYLRFVRKTFAMHQSLKSLTFTPSPGPIDIIRNGLIGKIPFLLSSLHRVLRQTHLPLPVTLAVSIWTHIAGQDTKEAPGAMAFVPGLFHNAGSFYPKGGMRAVASLLTKTAEELGVKFSYGEKVAAILTSGKRVTGVKMHKGLTTDADYIISNASGIGTYIELADNFPDKRKRELQKLPLQSPGMCIYMTVKGTGQAHYIRFRLKEKSCVAFVQPGLLDAESGQEGWYPARLIAPLDHEAASILGNEGQLSESPKVFLQFSFEPEIFCQDTGLSQHFFFG